jgi:hypothetical protein
MSTWFFPNEDEKYRTSFEKERPIHLDDQWSVKIPPNTIVREGKDYNGRYYVAWIDGIWNSEKNKWQSK